MKNNKIYITKISIDHIDEKSIMYQSAEYTDEYLDFRILKKSNNDGWLIEPLNIRIQNANIYEGVIQKNDNSDFKNVKYIIQSTDQIIIYEGLNIVDKLTSGSYEVRVQRELRKGYTSYFGGMNINPKSRFSLFRCMYQKEVNEFIETKSINSVWINESLEIVYSNQKKYIHYNLEKEINGNEEEDCDEVFELKNLSNINSSDKYKNIIESLKHLDKSRVKNRFKQFFRIIEGNVIQEDVKMILLDIEPPNRNYLIHKIGNKQLLNQSNINIIESQDEIKLISLNSNDKFILYSDYILKIPNHLNNLKEALKWSYGL